MSDYHKYIESKYASKLNELLTLLPMFCDDFFKVRGEALSASSMAKYASDFIAFFEWVLNNIPEIKAEKTADITLDDLIWIRETDIGDFLRHIRYNTVQDNSGNFIESAKSTVEGKSVSICSLFRFLHETNRIKNNPALAIKHRKVPKNKNIVFLDFEEQCDLIRCVDKGIGIPKEQLRFWKKNRTRDLAIICTFLDTGIRVSELAGIDLKDLNFKTHRINVTRKGGKEEWIVMSDLTEQTIKDYLEIRVKEYKPNDKETALFLSSRHQRMQVRNIETLVTKYANIALPYRYGEISPHKLRSTFATSLIRETGDIYLVASNLGHSSLDTTKIYAQATDEYRTRNRNKINDRRIFNSDDIGNL